MGGIQDKNVADDASIDMGKIGFPYILSGKHTDGTLPKLLWVAKGGADGAYNGSRKDPLLTIDGATGAQGALSRTVDGRGDRLALGPGIWRENVDIGSAVRNQKRDVGIIGSGGMHAGRTQIVGDGTTVGPTLRVRDGYLRGFILANLEVGSSDTADADRAQPLIDLETNDAAVLTANSSDEWALIQNVRCFGDGTPTAGLVLTGAVMVEVKNFEAAGLVRGIVFRGSLSNWPDNCRFLDLRFHDNVTFDIGTTGDGQGLWTFPLSSVNMTNILVEGAKFMDRGGTPVTNYIDYNNGGTHVNVVHMDCFFARAVAEATLLSLAVDDVVIGWSAAAAVNIIGA